MPKKLIGKRLTENIKLEPVLISELCTVVFDDCKALLNLWNISTLHKTIDSPKKQDVIHRTLVGKQKNDNSVSWHFTSFFFFLHN